MAKVERNFPIDGAFKASMLLAAKLLDARIMALEKELEHFNSIKADLIKNHDGKFALIQGERFCGAFDTPDNAYKEGVKLFGQTIFLVKRISEQEEVYRNQSLFLGVMNAHV